MTIRRFIGICIQTIVLTFLAILAARHVNFFSLITDLSADQAFDIGLASYLTILEAATSAIIYRIDDKKASISIVFSERKDDYNADSCPIMLCDRSKGVGYIWCHICLDGNVKHLRNADVEIVLPSWLSSQASPPYYTYNQACLSFDLKHSLPVSGKDHHTLEHFRIPFTINSGNTAFEMTLLPQIKNKDPMIKLESKGFRAKIK